MYTHTQKVNEDVAADTEERKGFDLSRGCQGWGLRVLGSGVKVSVVGLTEERKGFNLLGSGIVVPPQLIVV